MKTYIIILANTFPKGHPEEGKPTRFGASVVQNVKYHTLRENYEEWERKIKEIQAGEAVLSVRVWEDKPYRSKQMELLKLGAESVGIQKLHSFDKEHAYFMDDNGKIISTPLQELANNDGLALYEWKGWFENNAHLPLAVIHFTDFRYKKENYG